MWTRLRGTLVAYHWVNHCHLVESSFTWWCFKEFLLVTFSACYAQPCDVPSNKSIFPLRSLCVEQKKLELAGQGLIWTLLTKKSPCATRWFAFSRSQLLTLCVPVSCHILSKCRLLRTGANLFLFLSLELCGVSHSKGKGEKFPVYQQNTSRH